MTRPVPLDVTAVARDAIRAHDGRIAVFATPEAGMDPGARRVDRMTRGALSRLVESPAFTRLKPGESAELGYPPGLAAEAVQVVCLPRRTDTVTARRAGAAIGARLGEAGALVLAGAHPRAAGIGAGLALRAYDFRDHKSDPAPPPGRVTLMVTRPDAVRSALSEPMAAVEGVFLARDLVNTPANVLTTTAFAARLVEMRALGIGVEVLDEPALESLGLGALLAVGHGSESPSKLVVMQWRGGGEAAPLVLVGKGVVFDTGGVSIKSAAGMEEMTMDMGGAGVAAGVMHSLARRGARANVVAVLGLVENMVSGRALRPGDVVRSLKGDTIEVINTDAEGRLVLADAMWYAQSRFAPAAMIDMATLTGAMIVALGHERAGLFANDGPLADALLGAAGGEGEGLWRMPLDAAYDRQLKSRIADVKNTGGRPAGAITAARFLARFVCEGTPWAHLDIAGVTLRKEAGDLAPRGASGWGVLTLDRLVRERFETRG